MATAEIFEFFSGTNLLTNPVRRFEPQPILPSTPDEWYVQANSQSGQIRLPYLDAVTGPLYDGKTVTIIIDRVNGGLQVEIGAWTADGGSLLLSPAPVIIGGPVLPGTGPSYTAIATWIESTSTGFWQLILN